MGGTGRPLVRLYLVISVYSLYLDFAKFIKWETRTYR